MDGRSAFSGSGAGWHARCPVHRVKSGLNSSACLVVAFALLSGCATAVRQPEHRLSEGIRVGHSGETMAAVRPAPEVMYFADAGAAEAIASRRDGALGVREARALTAVDEWRVDPRPSLYDLRRFPQSSRNDNSFLYVAPPPARYVVPRPGPWRPSRGWYQNPY